jgi:hypothetical protein
MKWDHYNMAFLALQIPPRRIDEVFQAGAQLTQETNLRRCH